MKNVSLSEFRNIGLSETYPLIKSLVNIIKISNVLTVAWSNFEFVFMSSKCDPVESYNKVES